MYLVEAIPSLRFVLGNSVIRVYIGDTSVGSVFANNGMLTFYRFSCTYTDEYASILGNRSYIMTPMPTPGRVFESDLGDPGCFEWLVDILMSTAKGTL